MTDDGPGDDGCCKDDGCWFEKRLLLAKSRLLVSFLKLCPVVWPWKLFGKAESPKRVNTRVSWVTHKEKQQVTFLCLFCPKKFQHRGSCNYPTGKSLFFPPRLSLFLFCWFPPTRLERRGHRQNLLSTPVRVTFHTFHPTTPVHHPKIIVALGHRPDGILVAICWNTEKGPLLLQVPLTDRGFVWSPKNSHEVQKMHMAFRNPFEEAKKNAHPGGFACAVQKA